MRRVWVRLQVTDPRLATFGCRINFCFLQLCETLDFWGLRWFRFSDYRQAVSPSAGSWLQVCFQTGSSCPSSFLMDLLNSRKEPYLPNACFPPFYPEQQFLGECSISRYAVAQRGVLRISRHPLFISRVPLAFWNQFETRFRFSCIISLPGINFCIITILWYYCWNYSIFHIMVNF